MNMLRDLDNQILTDVNGFARHTSRLHGAALGDATYGLALFAALLLAGLWLNRTGTNRALAATGWASVPNREQAAVRASTTSGAAAA